MDVTTKARHLVAAITSEVPSYRGLDPETAADVLEANRLSVQAFEEMVRLGRVPGDEYLAPLNDSTARRVHQGIPLESVLRAFRLGTWTLWRDASRRVSPAEVTALTELTFEYIDKVSSLSERAFLRAREDQWSSRASLSTVFLSRLASNDHMDAREVLTYLRDLSLDPDAGYVGVLARPHLPADDYGGQLSRDFLPQMRRELGGKGILAALQTGVYGLLDVQHLDVVREAFMDLLDGVDRPYLVLGVGRVHTDAATGCRRSIEEAQRAVELGLRLNPENRVHSYDTLALFDLFRRSWVLDSFIEEHLGPLLRDPAQAPLLATLREFLAAQGQRKVAARQLGVHPNTVDYRLRKIEQLLGPFRGERQFLVQLAIRLVPMAEDHFLQENS